MTRSDGFRTWSIDANAHAYRVGQTIIPWSDIIEIVAFKRDLLTEDQICIGLHVGDGENYEYLEEDNPGYKAIVADLELRFGLDDGWWQRIAFPTFETNLSTVWERTD